VQARSAELTANTPSNPRQPIPTATPPSSAIRPRIPDLKLTERQRIGPERALEANTTPLAHSAKAQSSPELTCECRLDPQSSPATHRPTHDNPQPNTANLFNDNYSSPRPHEPTPEPTQPHPQPLAPDPRPKTDRASADRAGTSIGSEHHHPSRNARKPYPPPSLPASAGSIREAHPPTHHPTQDNPHPIPSALLPSCPPDPRPTTQTPRTSLPSLAHPKSDPRLP